MKAASTYFKNNKLTTEFERVFDVFKYSFEKHMPNVSLEILNKDETFIFNSKHSKDTQDWKNNNILKMLAWHAKVMYSPIGENLLLIDCDTYVKDDVSAIFKENFDIAYTGQLVKYNKICDDELFNSGVMFIKVSEIIKEFFTTWKEECLDLYNDPIKWENSIDITYGLTQPAFLLALKKYGKLKTLVLPRMVYNYNPQPPDPGFEDVCDFEKVKICHIQRPAWTQLTGADSADGKRFHYENFKYWTDLEKEKNLNEREKIGDMRIRG